MKYFHWSLAQLLIGLSFFLTIERIDFAQSNFIDLHSFVYVLTVIAVLLIILIPQLAQWPVHLLFSGGAAIFILLKLLVFNQRPILGGFYTYLTLTEAGFLLLLIYLAYQVALNLRDFREAVRYVSLAYFGQQLPKVEEVAPEIHREMTRSRHFHRSLSVIIVKPDHEDFTEAMPHLVAEVQKYTADLCLTARLANLIGDQTRVVDMVITDRENGRFIILCPEIDAQGSGMLTERICKAIKEQLAIKVSFGVASFPDEALTFESLIAEADKGLKHEQYHPTIKTHIHPTQGITGQTLTS